MIDAITALLFFKIKKFIVAYYLFMKAIDKLLKQFPFLYRSFLAMAKIFLRKLKKNV